MTRILGTCRNTIDDLAHERLHLAADLRNYMVVTRQEQVGELPSCS